MKLRRKYIPHLVVVVCLLGVAALAWLMYPKSGAPKQEYLTAPVQRGNIQQTVSANGTLQPINTVTVGTQVTGPVVKLYADYNQHVKKGELLAEIDPALLLAEIEQSEAQLGNAKSSMELAERNASRLKRLFAEGYVAKAELERAEQDAQSARSAYKVNKAQVDRDKKNLEYASVRSPVDGVVISRTVNEGQTVQASFQTPELFKIAEDMTQMQIELQLSESDIGRVKEKQPVFFTVDAYPEHTFDGSITQLRLVPNNQQGVVTYTVIISVNNEKKLLLPGMTAFVNVIVSGKEDVLMVPTAALRFAFTEGNHDASAEDEGTVIYRLEAGKPVPVKVEVGAYDERNVEIVSDQLKEGDTVILRRNSGPEEEEEL